MKSTKPPRLALSHRSRSSRSTDSHVTQQSPTPLRQQLPSTSEAREEIHGVSSPRPSMAASQPSLGPSTEVEEMDKLRKRMSEALALKQLEKLSSSTVKDPPTSVAQDDTSIAGVLGAQTGLGSEESLLSGTLSSDSAKTVKAPLDMTPGVARTPSYPFPRMQLKLNRGTSHRSAPSHKPFTLLSPTVTPTPEAAAVSQSSVEEGSSEVSTPVGQPGPGGLHAYEDPNFPTPDLYDVVLILNAEPGLDAWWANVCQVLSEAFGAERAALAVPGDITDLENVPWGQKATFNIYGTDDVGSSNVGSSTTSEVELQLPGRRSERYPSRTESPQAPRRPPLQSRHSIAGILPEAGHGGARQRPSGPPRAFSSMAGLQEEREMPSNSSRWPTRTDSTTSFDSPAVRPLYDSSASASSTLRCYVHRSLQPLETEPDALLVRTGVSSLFGKRRPVVLTRAYNDDGPVPDHSALDVTKARTLARSFSSTSGSQDENGQGMRFLKAFDEYEQPEPSPWSQSPAPSPAARPDPTESPFFVQVNSNVDESAFEQNPPPYDYAATANQSLEAIGADTSKTLVHIPLIQPVPSRGAAASSLRFPVAVLSLLSPVNPYPTNLRHSLTHLLPHIASSYSLAQQFSSLQTRLRGHGPGGQGVSFGLGGTFSDEGSELELVAELSEQIARNNGKEVSPKSQVSHSSPDDRTMFNGSLPGSAVSTPFLEQLGMSSGLSTTPGRSGVEMIDSYFSAKRSKGGASQAAVTPGAQTLPTDSPDKSRRSEKKPQTVARPGTKKVVIAGARQQEETTPNPHRTASITSESDNGDQWRMNPLERIETAVRRPSQFAEVGSLGERPLPELISQLMLNSVPLQLFLAKPKSGDLVWTNRKFDAFRSQGEERVRDPWKNVHDADRPGLVKGWTEALKSGSQFTHYARVKRFNSDSDFRWFIFRASTLLASNGRLLYWIGSFMDIHEQYMKSLEASERAATVARDAKLRALADSIPQILFEALEGEGIVAVNQQWHAYCGQTIEEARGLGFARQVHREDLHKCGILSPEFTAASTSQYTEQSRSSSSGSSNKTAQPPPLSTGSWHTPESVPFERLIKQGLISVETDENGRVFYSTEIRLRSKGGEFRWFLVRLVKVETDLISNARSSWYGTCTDIDIRKGLERELNAANRKVHQEMESKTKFFANMSHEIRTPLNGILGSMPWLVESALDHDQRRTVDTIQNSSNNLRELVDNILDVTKVEAGKMALVHKWFHLRTLLEEIIDTISSRAIERGLELNYTIDANVPSSVKGDPFRLRQILLNLMGNSVKFTEQGEVYTRCAIRAPDSSATNEPSHLLLAFDVMDTGRGFNPNEFNRIFQQFGQIDGGSSHDAGSGLGLFLSKQLVEMHGGHLSAKSQAGEGSTFSFYIKVEVAPTGSARDSPPPQITRPTQNRSSTSFNGSSRTRSDSRTPTMNMTRGVMQSPGQPPKFVASPETQSPANLSPAVVSPAVVSSSSSDPSLRSQSINIVQHSSASSMFPTPESVGSVIGTAATTERQALAEMAMASIPAFKRSKSDNDGRGLAPEQAHPTTYSIIVICPAEYARAAIKQHIEQVVPHQIAVNVTTLDSIGSFLDLVQGPASPSFSHIVLDLPASSDVMLFLRQMAHFTAPVIPDVIVITDHYQKRDILEDFTTLTTSGRRAYLVHKPVKPALFAMIFDPAQLRNLSRDAARTLAQTNQDNFKNVAIRVKESIGNKSHRILLVEDSDTNRKVILRYLTKVDLVSDTATDGLECTEMVLSKPQGYYSLIICDIQMPRKNGYEACAEIRRWEAAQGYPPVPIMALTANAMPEERAAAGMAGFTDYLTKPVNFNVLGTMMINLLDTKSPHVLLRDRPAES